MGIFFLEEEKQANVKTLGNMSDNLSEKNHSTNYLLSTTTNKNSCAL